MLTSVQQDGAANVTYNEAALMRTQQLMADSNA